MKNDNFIKHFAIFVIVALLALCLAKAFTYVGSVRRFTKGLESNWSGGLDRTVILYDYNGKPIKSWSGKIDMSEATDETDFLVNGRRVIIHGGIAVIEENQK